MTGSELIAQERQRQMEQEGWTPEHDAQHDMGQLIDAARCYCGAFHSNAAMSSQWPWAAEWWKPKDRVRNLVRAGALIAAEIDRIQNAALTGAEGVPCSGLVGDLRRQVETMRRIADDTERSVCEGDPVRRAFFEGRVCCLREQALNIEDIIANDQAQFREERA